MSDNNDDQLTIMHDHHKDSFSYIRDRERQRDRLFLITIALFSLLAIAILYTASIAAVLRSVKVAETQADLGALPSTALITAIWIFTLAITLRYCQVSIVVERQYLYLHRLEARISEILGDSTLYTRESIAYEENYPAFSRWVWISYVFVFPAIATVICVALAVAEWLTLTSGWPYKALDSVVCLGIITSLVLYRIYPMLHGPDVEDEPSSHDLGLSAADKT